MAEHASPKPFTAERLRNGARHGAAPEGADDSAAAARHDEIMALLREIRDLVHGPGQGTASAEDASAAEETADESDGIQWELRRLRDAILQTKREIAALRRPGEAPDCIITATDELDAVVNATEGATHTILEASEKIDELAQRTAQTTDERHTADVMSEVQDLIIKVFEACNFQDITGQRINKVVGTMKFIEDRVNRMIEIWGDESFNDVEPSVPAAPPAGDGELLSGPRLESEDGVSQEDIDKMFG